MGAGTAARLRIVPRPQQDSPLALWHLLSLDAPTVAAVWTYFIAVCCHLRLPSASVIAMAIAVWMLYASDRILDTRPWTQRHPDLLAPVSSKLRLQSRSSLTIDRTTAREQGFEARHLFHHTHRRSFLAGVALASLLLAVLLPRLDPRALEIDVILGALLLGYFVLIHAASPIRRLPKEFAVGLFFSAAVFVPTIVRRPDLQRHLVPYALLFGALCTLNCLFIFAWEHPSEHASAISRPHLTTRVALKHLNLIALLLLLVTLALSAPHHPQAPIAIAIALSTALLLLLHRFRGHLTPLHLRACADLALLTPVLLFPFLPR